LSKASLRDKILLLAVSVKVIYDVWTKNRRLYLLCLDLRYVDVSW